MGRTRIVLLFNDENADQKEVCDYLKSQPRSKTALVTELVQAWLRAKEGGSPVYAGEPVENTGQSIEALKSQITEELLQDRSFIQKVTERISSQVPERGDSDDTDCPEEETGMGFDFDEDMLLSGMSMFETQI